MVMLLVLFTCIVGSALGLSEGNSEVVYKCAPKESPICFVNNLTFEDETGTLTLQDVTDKKTLKIKAGKIVALRPKQCTSLSTFEKVVIGRVGLTELCFTTSFVEVNAEHNRLRKLHVRSLDEATETYRMEVLRLNGNELESVDGICNFVALKELHLEQNLLSTLDMSCFAKMDQLKRLHLAYNRLNMITTSISELSLPALSFVGLQNNTLTALNMHQWSLPALEVLELSSNNLTNVLGLENFEMLTDISLAGNSWHCDELDRILMTLDSKGVSVKDGDQSCSGIWNGTICCSSEQRSTESTLLDELQKLQELQQRYDAAEVFVRDKVKQEIETFERKMQTLKETYAKRDVNPSVPKPESVDATLKEETSELKEELPPPGPVVEKSDCICSQEGMDALELKLGELEKSIKENNVTLQALRDKQSQVSYMALLTKHEFRTSVKRGEYKLKELSSMLAMLREHIRNKQMQN